MPANMHGKPCEDGQVPVTLFGRNYYVVILAAQHHRVSLK